MTRVASLQSVPAVGLSTPQSDRRAARPANRLGGWAFRSIEKVRGPADAHSANRFCLGLTVTPSFALTAQASTSEAHAFGYTFADINVPGSQPDSTDDFGLNNWGQVVGTYNDSAGNFDGFLYTGGKYVTVDAWAEQILFYTE